MPPTEAVTGKGNRSGGIWEAVRRAFAEFLTVPTVIIAGFLLLGLGSYWLDRAAVASLTPFRLFLQRHAFADAGATRDLLAAVAAGIITVTSITISLLLLALQQSAATLSSAVFDQFLLRRHNQIYFGYFIGLALYALITLATVSEQFNPIFGATLAFGLTVIGLYLLLVLLYTAVNQMRPEEIVQAIHDHTLAARERQLRLLRSLRAEVRAARGVRAPVRAHGDGFVTRLNLHLLRPILQSAPGTEVILHVSIGKYISVEDVIATVVAPDAGTAEQVGESVVRAVQLERQRDLGLDPAYGIEQLEMIGWTSISTSKSNPAPGLLVIRALRSLLAHWVAQRPEAQDDAQEIAVVYEDNTPERLLSTVESLAVVSSESMQHQCFTEVIQTCSILFERLPAGQQARVEDMILRALSALGDHVLTRDLDQALGSLGDTLVAHGRVETAARLEESRNLLGESVGRLNSRATRVARR